MSQLLSKVTVASCSFYIIGPMFNVSDLLLDDALLKCFVTEVLFTVVAFKTLTFCNVCNVRRIAGIGLYTVYAYARTANQRPRHSAADLQS